MTRILLVDDHQVVRQNIHKMLEEHDAWQICAEAKNGTEAVAKFKESAPDVTIMDFHMPEMNGLEASRQILNGSPGAPILMLTIYPSGELVDKAKRAGIKGFCPKSEITCIVDAVSALLSGGTYYRN